MKNRPVSLAELPVGPDSGVTFADALPDFAQPDSIAINTDALSRVARWGGFYPDVQLLAHAGPTSSQRGGFLELGDGSHKSAVVTATQPTVTWGYQSYDQRYRRRASLTLKLNTNELTQRVQHMNGGALRKPEAWAGQIHEGVAHSLRAAAQYHLMSGNPLPRYEAVVGGGMLAIGQTMGTFLGSQELWADQRAVPSLIFGTLPTAMTLLTKALEAIDSKELSLRDFAFSVCPVWQVDRWAAVSGLTRVLRFASSKPAA